MIAELALVLAMRSAHIESTTSADVCALLAEPDPRARATVAGNRAVGGERMAESWLRGELARLRALTDFCYQDELVDSEPSNKPLAGLDFILGRCTQGCTDIVSVDVMFEPGNACNETANACLGKNQAR